MKKIRLILSLVIFALFIASCEDKTVTPKLDTFADGSSGIRPCPQYSPCQ